MTPSPPSFVPDDPLILPSTPSEPAPAAFPLVASLAPLVVAGVIWLVTGSAFVLLFALLGPVIAVAGVFDGRRTIRRTRRRDAAAYSAALADLRATVAERHRELRRQRRHQLPSAGLILESPDQPSRWRSQAREGVLVVLGSGTAPSGIRLEGAGSHRALREWAASLTDAPITADASRGVALVGPAPLVHALARALLLQLAFTLPPDRFALDPVAQEPGGLDPCAPEGETDGDWGWTRSLPHAVPPGGGAPARRAGRSGVAGTVVLVRFTETSSAAPQTSNPAGAPWLVVATGLDDVPPNCATVVRVHGPTRAEVVFPAVDLIPEGLSSATGSPAGPGVRHVGTVRHRDFRPELISREQSRLLARLLRDRAETAGLLGGHRSLPARVTRAELAALGAHPSPGPTPEPGKSPAGQRRGLGCAVGVGAHGPVWLDLVDEGPHALVGGTTGSGKSELLVSWVSLMAVDRSPDEVTFLLIDFKGGAGFRPLAVLPHCVGLVTDLDERQAERALASLAAELRHREGVLAAAGARDLDELRSAHAARGSGEAALPRLVIVVDEFATLVASFPELHALFVDVAARGRSLGVHLVLCTQRPTGVVRDALLANCTLRISLRVNNAADSQAVLGTDAAASIPAAAPGRCFIARADGDPQACQVATTLGAEIEAVATAAASAAAGRAVPSRSPRRPWLDPLPARVTLTDLNAGEVAGGPSPESTGDGPLPTGGFPFGLLDEPDLQRYSVARYGPEDGNLFILGGARSGKTSALGVFAAQARAANGRVSRPNTDIEETWDTLGEIRRWVDQGGINRDGADRGRAVRSTRLLLLDDFDSVSARWEPDHREAAFDALTSLLRDGPAVGLRVVIAAQRLTGALQNLAALCQDHLVLRLPDRATFLAAGGQSAPFDPTLPPGGGHWRGRRIQVLAPDAVGLGPVTPADEAPSRDPRATVTVLTLDVGTRIILVSGSPARAAAALRADASHPDVVELAAGAGAADPAVVLARTGTATVLVGDPETWQANWSLLAALRVHALLVFDGCTLADYRVLSRRRDLPPPLAPGRGHLWCLSPDGELTRVVFGA